MYLAHGVGTLAGVAVGVATVTIATVAAVTTGTARGTAAAPTVTITPGIQHQQREPRTGPSTAGDSAIVAVIGTSSLNVGMLQYRAREIIERIAANSSQIGVLAAPVRPANGDAAKTSRSLPRRRPGSSS